MDKIINYLLLKIQQHGLSAVFFGSFLEEAIAPIPSPAVMMGAGFMLLSKFDSVSTAFLLEMIKIALVGGVGALLGSYFIYALGFYGGKPLIEKTKRFTGVKWEKVEKMQARLERSKNEKITIAALRSIPVMPAVVIAITSGLLRVNLLTYTISFYIGGVIRNLIFLIIGWKVGDAYKNLAHTFDSVQNVIQLLIAVALFGGLAYLYIKRERQEKVNEKQK